MMSQQIRYVSLDDVRRKLTNYYFCDLIKWSPVE